VFRVRQNSLEAHLPWLDAQWGAGGHNAAALWRKLKEQGFGGSARVVAEWATRRRQADRTDIESLARVPSARTIARLMSIGRDHLTKAETLIIAAIEGGAPSIVETREIIADFQIMIRRRALAQLPSWMERAAKSLVASFGNGVKKDEAAVRAAIASTWSNGQTEGQITRLKLVKRQMSGRGKIDPLQARLIGVV
jgi:transposase